MLYAQSGINAISGIPGCPQGHGYAQRADKTQPRMSVHGCAHETHLREVKDPLWASTVATVPLNEAEQKAADDAKAGREKAVFENAANTAAAIGDIAQVLSGLVERVNAMQPQGTPVPAVPEAPAPVSAAPETAKPRTRRTAAKASA